MASDVSLDIEQPQQLGDYLRCKGHVIANEPVYLQRLAGGVSNRTMLVKFSDGRAWVIKQALSKLRVAVDWFSDPARIEREAQGLRRLAEIAPTGTITPLVFEDHERHLLVMNAVPEPHQNWKTLLLVGQIDLFLVQRFGELLATIHRRSFQQKARLAPEFANRSFFESLRLEPYYGYTAEQVPAAMAFFQRLMADTRCRSDALVHGDFSPKNVLIHNGHMVLLDHEVVHWGDPAFDLGFSLTHFLSKAHYLPAHRTEFASAAKHYWNNYRQALGEVEWTTDLEPRAVRHTLACLLARVAGRSPLEYLGLTERTRQTHVVTDLLSKLPERIECLIDSFLERIEHHESY